MMVIASFVVNIFTGYFVWIRDKRIFFSAFDSKLYFDLKMSKKVNPEIDSIVYYKDKQV